MQATCQRLQTFYRFSGFLNLKTALVGISRSLCGTVYMGIIVVVVIIIVIIVKTSKAHTYTPKEHALKKKGKHGRHRRERKTNK